MNLGTAVLGEQHWNLFVGQCSA
jgi:hypothetical protein